MKSVPKERKKVQKMTLSVQWLKNFDLDWWNSFEKVFASDIFTFFLSHYFSRVISRFVRQYLSFEDWLACQVRTTYSKSTVNHNRVNIQPNRVRSGAEYQIGNVMKSMRRIIIPIGEFSLSIYKGIYFRNLKLFWKW